MSSPPSSSASPLLDLWSFAIWLLAQSTPQRISTIQLCYRPLNQQQKWIVLAFSSNTIDVSFLIFSLQPQPLRQRTLYRPQLNISLRPRKIIQTRPRLRSLSSGGRTIWWTVLSKYPPLRNSKAPATSTIIAFRGERTYLHPLGPDRECCVDFDIGVVATAP
jgi:hypothetical protein